MPSDPPETLPGPAPIPTGGPIQITMNTPYGEMIAPNQTRIVFVHVGKCAGSSVILALAQALTDRYVMYEMHTRAAGQIIRDTLASKDEDFIYLVTLRDPIARFVSAFNWDKHALYLAGRVKELVYRAHFEEFTDVDTLARALSSENSERAERALEFARFGHMGMGPAWYLPEDVVKALPLDRTFLCETENFARDLQRFAGLMDSRYLEQQIVIPRDKADYKQSYENPEAVFGPPLSDLARRNLRILLDEDYRICRKLKRRFAPI